MNCYRTSWLLVTFWLQYNFAEALTKYYVTWYTYTTKICHVFYEILQI